MENDVRDLNRIYNADQTGLFYQKLPNHFYCHTSNASSARGVKWMRDKNRLTLMVCTSAKGDKVPLALIGHAKTPNCFRLRKKVPLPYFNQCNAWFDRQVMSWWLKTVFSPHRARRWGSQKVILILDNCTAHTNLGQSAVPDNIILLYLPERLTARHHPADLGIIAIIKSYYKRLFWNESWRLSITMKLLNSL